MKKTILIIVVLAIAAAVGYAMWKQAQPAATGKKPAAPAVNPDADVKPGAGAPRGATVLSPGTSITDDKGKALR